MRAAASFRPFAVQTRPGQGRDSGSPYWWPGVPDRQVAVCSQELAKVQQEEVRA